MTIRSLAHRGELLLSLGLLALGAYILFEARTIADPQAYEQLGPRLFPNLVGTGLAILGAVMSWHALSGGWRNVPMDQAGHDRPDRFAFIVLSAALIAHMALIGSIGFVLASTLLFVLIARGFGSRRWLRDLGVGVVVSLAAFYLFTLALGLHLTTSPLGVI